MSRTSKEVVKRVVPSTQKLAEKAMAYGSTGPAKLKDALRQPTEADEIAKRRKFNEADEAMRKMLAELKEKDTVVQINPDKQNNDVATDALTLLKKVSNFLAKEHYEAAESLLRHIYRITPQLNARQALSSARRLCHEAVKLENKWVRRRATLLRRKEKSAAIKKERSKYTMDRRSDIADFLSTAMLEIAENVEKRGGEYFTKLTSSFEVILPPILDENGMVLTKAPVMFNAKKFLDERRFKEVINKAHGFDPGLKRIERGFFVCNTIAIVGVEKQIEPVDGNKNKREKQLRRLEKALAEKLNRGVNVVGYTLVHRSSKLFWYAYDFPVDVEMMQFADIQVAEDYGSNNTPLLQMDNGRLSRDEFVKLRESGRQRAQLLRSVQLREMRLSFLNEHNDMLRQIKDLQDAAIEMAEKMALLRKEFALKTATKVEEDGINNGLGIGRYKSLYTHSKRMYAELAELDTAQRDRLHMQLFEDRMQARLLYYEYREMNARRIEFAERAVFLTAALADKRDIARGTGKSLSKTFELSA